jgi:hypothetical protein
VVRLPAYGTQLPGADATLLLKPSDPLRLFGYATFHSDGSYLLDPASGDYKRVGHFLFFNPAGEPVVLSPDGWDEATIGNASVTFTDRRTGYDRTTADLKYPPYSSKTTGTQQFSPDGRYLLAMTAGKPDNHAVVINVKTLQQRTLTLPGNQSASFWWTPDSAHIVVPAGQDNAAVYDLNGHVLRRLSLGRGSVPVDSAFGLLLYYCPESVDPAPLRTGCVANVWTRKLLARIPLPNSPQPGTTMLGIYDRSHFYGWAGNKIVVRDYGGNVVRALFIDHRHDDSTPPSLFFTRSPQPAGS